MKTKQFTIESEFAAGAESGKHQNQQNDAKALLAVTRKDTEPLIRAYWSGYLCQIGDLSKF
jgi:hypothetical protein